MAVKGTQLLYKLMAQGLPKLKLMKHQKILARGFSSSSSFAGYENSRIMDKILTSETALKLDQYSRYAPHPISLHHLMDNGKNASTRDSFLFLKKEICTRLANMIMEIRLLPQVLLTQRECAEILNDYIISFRDLLSFESDWGTPEDLERFIVTLNMIRSRHLDTVPLMAQAVHKLDAKTTSDGVRETIQYFLDRLYTNRISIHMLISHYNALLGETKRTHTSGMVGHIDPECNLLDVCMQAYEDASGICDAEYFDHPKLKATALDTSGPNEDSNERVVTTLVPSHLHHILFEIFKNSMRATCEFSEKKNLAELPHIRCRIFKTQDDLTIKISDLGGGIKRESSERMFDYMYSTAPKVDVPKGGSYGAGLASDTLPMHGLGYGLPLSRVYARYFRGDLKVSTVHGYGTDVYVYLQRLAQENLPVYNAKSSARLQNVATQVQDWTDVKKKF